MPKLVLMFDDRILSESGVGLLGVTIGRLPDNTIVIDNPAVSGHHARVLRDGDSYVVEDLESTNGTFVNEVPITRQTLADGDIVLVGKHTLVFDQRSGSESPSLGERGPAVPELGGTRVLDTEHHRALLAKWDKEQKAKQAASAASTPAPPKTTAAPGIPATPGTPGAPKPSPGAPPRVGVLHVLAGRTEHGEYSLVAQTSMIGKAATSLVRLKGWFKPKVAASIARKGESYTVTSLHAKTQINGQRLTGRHELKDGDVLQVAGVTLEFRLRR